MTSVFLPLFFAALHAAEQPAWTSDLDISQLDQPPKLVKRVQPEYPFLQARAGVEASVLVEFIIDKNGGVQNPIVVESNNPAFERPALDAVLKWRFSPGRKAGLPVFVRAQRRIEFAMLPGYRSGPSWVISKRKDHATLPEELQWDVAPVPLSTAFPVYPYAAIEGRRKGSVMVSFIVGPDGRAARVTILEATTPEMSLAAEAAIDVWRFTPAKKKTGTPCFASLGMRYEFEPSGDGDVPVAPAALRILSLMKNRPAAIVPAGQLDAAPKPLSRRPPVFPLALKKVGQVGEAMIEFFIDQEGDAQLPQIISSTEPAFGYAAAQAVAAWRFEPPRKNGKTVITRVRVPIAFNLDQPPTDPTP